MLHDTPQRPVVPAGEDELSDPRRSLQAESSRVVHDEQGHPLAAVPGIPHRRVQRDPAAQQAGARPRIGHAVGRKRHRLAEPHEVRAGHQIPPASAIGLDRLELRQTPRGVARTKLSFARIAGDGGNSQVDPVRLQLFVGRW